VVFENPMVSSVCNEHVRRTVYRHTNGAAEAVGGYATQVAIPGRETSALAENMVGGAVGERSVELKYSTLIAVRDVKTARTVYRHSGRNTKTVRGYAAVVAEAHREIAALPENPVRHGAAGKRGVVLEHAIVVDIRDVEVACAIDRRRAWSTQARC